MRINGALCILQYKNLLVALVEAPMLLKVFGLSASFASDWVSLLGSSFSAAFHGSLLGSSFSSDKLILK
jgi:hypothetical protein